MISKYYTETLTLLSPTTSTGGYWNESTAEAYTTAATVKAAVNLLSAPERAEYGGIGFDAQYKCFTAPSSEVYEGRRLLWDSETYQIVDVPKNTLQKGHHLKFLIRNVGDA
jgi:hypothetical protein